MKQFVQLNETEFDRFSRSSLNPAFLQSAAMGRSQAERGQTIHYYGLKDDDSVIAAGLFTVRPVRKIFQVATAVGGLMIDYSNPEDLRIMRDGLKQTFGRMGIARVSFNPNFSLQQRNIDGLIVPGGEDHHDWVQNLIAAGFTHHGFRNEYGTMDGRWFFVKDLRAFQTPEELIASFDTQNRWATRKTQKLGITVRDLPVGELDRFIDLMRHTSERRGFENRDRVYYESLIRQFSKEDGIRILVAELDLKHHEAELLHLRGEQEAELAEAQALFAERPTKKMGNRVRVAQEAIDGFNQKLTQLEELRPDGPVILMAGALFVRYGNTVTYLFSGAYDKYLSFNAPYAIQWEAMNWALSSGADFYDFYMTAGRYAGFDDEGVYHFKKGFGGYVVERPGKFSLVTSPLRDRLLRRVAPGV